MILDSFPHFAAVGERVDRNLQAIFFGVQFFCLQFEASCLQLSFSAYNCAWELFCLQLELVVTVALGVLSHHLKCEMKSLHSVDVS